MNLSYVDLLPPPPEDFANEMANYVDHFISAISIIEKNDDRDPPGDSLGTGAFILLGKQIYVVTC
jgi:hypothetical protein